MYECEKCGRKTVIRSRIKSGEFEGKKVCSYCYNKINPIKSRIKNKKRFSNEQISSMRYFFEYHINKKWNPKCENCGYLLQDMNKKNCAHILPKSIFKSVAVNLDNEMDLCSTFDREDGQMGCHERYDSSWEAARQMKVFSIAKQRYLKFKHLITESHKILDNFKSEL